MDSLDITEAQSAAVAVAPRVTLQSMEDKIAAEYSFTLDKALDGCPLTGNLDIFTVSVIVMQNGFIVLGESAPASSENFNAELGAKFARENAIRKLWGFEGYALREKLSA
jgi:hypothetical protein